ncbi:uncharacterized protein G2W53_017058 [Senna tora]|uniref:Uncharacterized protein n=1 Tax=Senna tora TaxID=362788 RepID=A0A834TQK5_9FABA|nr:uncharacterized protein G2W53_017058 [Senna tora]
MLSMGDCDQDEDDEEPSEKRLNINFSNQINGIPKIAFYKAPI